MPSKWKKVDIGLALRCEEFNAQNVLLAFYGGSGDGVGWNDNTLSLDQVAQYLAEHGEAAGITFVAMINIARITLLDDKILYNFHSKEWKEMIPHSFTWKIDEKLLNEMKNAKCGIYYQSPIFLDTWSLLIWPNGEYTAGQVDISLHLCTLPLGGKFCFSCKFCLKGNGVEVASNNGDHELDTEKETDAVFCHDMMKFETDFKSFDRLSIEIIIGERSNVELEQDAMNEWIEYAKQTNVIKQCLGDKIQCKDDGGVDIVQELMIINHQIDVLLNKHKSEIGRDESVEEWLRNTVKLPEYYQIFVDEGFDNFEIIGDITMDDLKHMNIVKRAHQQTILKYVKKLNDKVAT